MVSVDWTVRISLWFSIVCVFCQVSRMCSVCHREELYIEKKKKKLKKENWLQKKIKEISLKTVSRYRINVKSASKIQSEIELFEADLTNQQFFYGKWCLLFLVDEKFSDTEKKFLILYTCTYVSEAVFNMVEVWMRKRNRTHTALQRQKPKQDRTMST